MKNIQRLFLRKYTAPEVEMIVKSATETIVKLVNPTRVIVFGSATSNQFDDASDLDFVVVFDTADEAKQGRLTLYRNGHLEGRIVDFLCVDEATYRRKSQVGGVYFIAAEEGKIVYQCTRIRPS